MSSSSASSCSAADDLGYAKLEEPLRNGSSSLSVVICEGLPVVKLTFNDAFYVEESVAESTRAVPSKERVFFTISSDL